MTGEQISVTDSKYCILSEISENKNVTQRELSKKLSLSLGSVNLLINKMIHEGLIKIEHVSQKQALYMLTPKGMMEKANKTVQYLKIHYKAIYETKETIKRVITDQAKDHDAIYVLSNDREMTAIIGLAVSEYMTKNNKTTILMIEDEQDIHINEYESPVLIYMDRTHEQSFNTEGIETINLMESL